MPFTIKAWMDGRAGGTPTDAAAWRDMETRLSGWTDAQLSVINSGTVVANTTVNIATYPRDVVWVVTLGASSLKLDIVGWAAGKTVLLVCKQDSTGGRALAAGGWPSAKWDSATPPPQTTTPSGIDVRWFFSDGTYQYGFESGTAMG